MPEADRIREMLQDKLERYEAGLYGLIRDIRKLLPHIGRDEVKMALAKVDMAASAIDALIRSDPSDQDTELRGVYAASDQLLLLRADLERKTRAAVHKEEHLEHEGRQVRARHVREELERELGHGLGGED